jgi:hypothetical protein
MNLPPVIFYCNLLLKERERKKLREVEIRRLALEQKKRMELTRANNYVRI